MFNNFDMYMYKLIVESVSPSLLRIVFNVLSKKDFWKLHL